MMETGTSFPFKMCCRICLPKAANASCAGDQATVTGWGRTQNRPRSIAMSLQKATVTVMNDTLCRLLHHVLPGPLQCLDEENNGKWTLAGLLSRGDERCAEASKPGVYAKVSSVLDWIIRSSKPKAGEKSIFSSLDCGKIQEFRPSICLHLISIIVSL